MIFDKKKTCKTRENENRDIEMDQKDKKCRESYQKKHVKKNGDITRDKQENKVDQKAKKNSYRRSSC